MAEGQNTGDGLAKRSFRTLTLKDLYRHSQE